MVEIFSLSDQLGPAVVRGALLLGSNLGHVQMEKRARVGARGKVKIVVKLRQHGDTASPGPQDDLGRGKHQLRYIRALHHCVLGVSLRQEQSSH